MTTRHDHMTARNRGTRKRPDHPLYVWLDAANKTTGWLGGILGVTERTIQYWIAGERIGLVPGRKVQHRAPAWARERIAELSRGKVQATDWDPKGK